MKNKSIIIALFLSMNIFSCQKEVSLDKPTSKQPSIGTNFRIEENKSIENIKEDLIIKITNSKHLEKLYDLSVNDKESNRLKEKLNEKIKSKMQNIKSQSDYETLVNEVYANPSKKLKQQENIYNSLLNLKNDFKELDKFDSFEISQIFEIAANRYISNKKARIPNPDDCFRLCQEQFNSSVSHSWSQFLAYSAGCMIASPGIWTYFACQGIAAYVYDNQFDGHLDSFGICAKNCGF